MLVSKQHLFQEMLKQKQQEKVLEKHGEKVNTTLKIMDGTIHIIPESRIDENGLDFIFLVTPETSEERLRKLDSLSTGFLYAVSSSATTGSDKDFNAVEQYLLRLQEMNLKNPVLVGFGIKDKETFESASKYSNGAIIGTAFIKALENSKDIALSVKQFLSSII